MTKKKKVRRRKWAVGLLGSAATITLLAADFMATSLGHVETALLCFGSAWPLGDPHSTGRASGDPELICQLASSARN